MKKIFLISFSDQIEADSEEAAFDILLAYLRECVEFGDITAFEFVEKPNEEDKSE